MKKIAIVLIICFICGTALAKNQIFDFDSSDATVTEITAQGEIYKKGVNDALEAIMLLNLELEIKGELKTWGEMLDIVRGRLLVEDRK